MRASTSDAIQVRAAVGLGAAIGERHETLAGVAQQPAVEGPSVDPVAGGDIDPPVAPSSTSLTTS
jgi:hypothetical protein